MARRRAVSGSRLLAGVRAVWASFQALVPAHPVSASLPVSAWARAVSVLSPALASEETASTEISIAAARSIAPVVVSQMRGIMTATLVLAMAGLAATARADGPGASACAANLAPDGKAIYAATVAAKPTLETLRSVVERQTRSLAMGGKIARGEARDNATAAGECVKIALQ
jgi:hypothetical protein